MAIGRILVPLDGSAVAEAALPQAVLLARATRRPLILVRVVAPLPWILAGVTGVPVLPTEDEPWETAIVDAHNYLTGVAAHLTDSGLTVSTEVLEGEPAAAIVEYAAAQGDLVIALATHGRSGLGRLLLGSVAERILHATPVPLLLVRPPAAPPRIAAPPASRPYERILVPLDGSPFAEQALDQAAGLAGPLGATLVLVAVVPTSDDRQAAERGVVAPRLSPAQQQAALHLTRYLTARAAALQAPGALRVLHVRTQVAYGRPAAALLRESASIEADLIIMATHGRSGLAGLWLGSVAHQVAEGAPCPVLFVRPRQAVTPLPVGAPGRAEGEFATG